MDSNRRILNLYDVYRHLQLIENKAKTQFIKSVGLCNSLLFITIDLSKTLGHSRLKRIEFKTMNKKIHIPLITVTAVY